MDEIANIKNKHLFSDTLRHTNGRDVSLLYYFNGSFAGNPDFLG